MTCIENCYTGREVIYIDKNYRNGRGVLSIYCMGIVRVGVDLSVFVRVGMIHVVFERICTNGEANTELIMRYLMRYVRHGGQCEASGVRDLIRHGQIQEVARSQDLHVVNSGVRGI